jgi:hypothetical protein
MSLLELLEERLGADDLYIFRLLADSQIDSEGGVAYLKESAKNVAEERRRARQDTLKNIPHDSESDSEQSMASSMKSYASSLADTPQIQFATMASTGSESDVSSNAHIELDPLPGRRKQKTESLESISTQKKQIIYDDGVWFNTEYISMLPEEVCFKDIICITLIEKRKSAMDFYNPKHKNDIVYIDIHN